MQRFHFDAARPPAFHVVHVEPPPVVVHRANAGAGADAAGADIARRRAKRNDFAYPYPIGPGGEAFLDKTIATFQHADTPDPSARGLYIQPRADHVQAYATMLRAGRRDDALAFRKQLIAAYRQYSAYEAMAFESWLENVDVFLRRAADLENSALPHLAAEVRPFASAEVRSQTERGLALLSNAPETPPVLTSAAEVITAATAERSRRLEEIETFYSAALQGGSIQGVPSEGAPASFWLAGGRLVFDRLADAELFAPRPVFARTFNFWPTSIRKFKEYEFGPLDYDGARPTSVEYVSPKPVSWVGSYPYNAYTPITFDPADDRDPQKDRYRLRDGPWRHYERITTPELEQKKIQWYARLVSEVRGALNYHH